MHAPSVLVDGLARGELLAADVAREPREEGVGVGPSTPGLVRLHVLPGEAAAAVRARHAHVSGSGTLVDSARLATVQLLGAVHQRGGIVAVAVHDTDVLEELVAEALFATQPAGEYQRALPL